MNVKGLCKGSGQRDGYMFRDRDPREGLTVWESGQEDAEELVWR